SPSPPPAPLLPPPPVPFEDLAGALLRALTVGVDQQVTGCLVDRSPGDQQVADAANPVASAEQRPVGRADQAAGQGLRGRPQVDQQPGLLQGGAVLGREDRAAADRDYPAGGGDGPVGRRRLGAGGG